MKKIFGTFLAALLVTTSCTPNRDKEGFPLNPEEGESYTRSDGSSGVWNAMLGYWMISSMINGRRVSNNYYPSSNTFTNSSGQTISRPTYYAKPSSSSSSSKSGFGSSSRSRSSGS